jgi:hypothetical protein
MRTFLDMNRMKKRKEPEQLDFGFQESCSYCQSMRRLRQKLEAKGWIPTKPGAGFSPTGPAPLDGQGERGGKNETQERRKRKGKSGIIGNSDSVLICLDNSSSDEYPGC